ncbi:CheR family methyltransferase [Sneathiella glossodoripedis]|uniref:CheR family methyltransferase n=1 Tax=Sneathiella glossodoripedis TaxID=418853 RepID=UPI00047262F8|nr:CheR family methyltransferase [Sneathiella glossodoripedis]
MNQVIQNMEKQREFALTQREFEKLTGLVHSLTGIVLGEHKKDMLYSRLARRLRQLGLQSFSQYCELLDSRQAGEETGFLVNAVTTNLTKFFRESHHFDSLTEHLRSLSMNTERSKINRSIRIWSAGCSSGEEPYSIASVINSSVATLKAWDVKVLATDLDTNMIRTGSEGIYKTNSFEGIEGNYRQILEDNVRRKNDVLHIKEMTKNLVHFKQLNLLHDWPMQRKYDAIFCRNVLIYFDNPTKNSLVQRYANLLQPGGMLFLGHSESLHQKPEELRLIGKTTYIKEEAA